MISTAPLRVSPNVRLGLGIIKPHVVAPIGRQLVLLEERADTVGIPVAVSPGRFTTLRRKILLGEQVWVLQVWSGIWNGLVCDMLSSH